MSDYIACELSTAGEIARNRKAKTKRTINSKIAGGLGLGLLLSVLAGGFAYSCLNELNKLSEVSGQVAQEGFRLDLARSMQINIDAEVRAQKNSIPTSSDEETAKFIAERKDLRSKVIRQRDALRDMESDEGQRMIDVFSAAYGRLEETLDQVAKIATLNSANRAADMALTDRGKRIDAFVTAASDGLTAILKASTAENADRVAHFRMSTIAYWRDVRGIMAVSDIQTLGEAGAELASSSEKLRAEAPNALQIIGRVDGTMAKTTADAFDDLMTLAQSIVDTTMRAGNIKAIDLSMGEGFARSSAAISAADAYTAAVVKKEGELVARAAAVSNDAKMILIGVVAASLLIAVIAAMWIASGISRGVSLARAVAIGDLSQTITATSRDEIGDLATALNAMTANFNTRAAVADAIAAGDLTVVSHPLSDKNRLGLVLRAMLGNCKSGRLPLPARAGCRLVADRPGDPAARQGDAGECRCVGTSVPDIRANWLTRPSSCSSSGSTG